METSCEMDLKGEFYEKWRTDVLIIIKIYREVDSFFKKSSHCKGKCIFENKHLHWECFQVQLLLAVSVYILSGKGANQLQILYIRTGKHPRKPTFLLKVRSSNVFPIFFREIWRSFTTTAKILALESYVLAYTADKDHTKIL